MRGVPVLAPVLLVVLGCTALIPARVTIEPKVNLAKKTLLVVPFSDSEHAYFDSPDGVGLAELIIREVRQGAPKARVVELDELHRLYGGQDLEAVGWKTVGAAVGAEYVLVGRIVSFTLRDPRTRNLLLGDIVLELKVVSVADGSVVFSPVRSETSFRWSETGDPDTGTPDFDTTPEKIRQGTLQEAGRRISDFFCARRIGQAQYLGRRRTRGQMLAP
jgi:hypothetical protein